MKDKQSSDRIESLVDAFLSWTILIKKTFFQRSFLF